jgi:hypothetical protein
MSFDMKTPEQREGRSSSPFLGEKPEHIEDPSPKLPPDMAPTITRSGKMLAQWETLEHAPVEHGQKTYAVVIAVFIAIIAYAIYTDSPLMAIVFILIGMVGYLSLNRPEEPTRYTVTDNGITVGREFYPFEDIISFFILEDHPDFPKHLVIQTDGWLVSHIHIPLAEQRAEAIRSILIASVPEKKYEPGLIDTIEKMFHI